uniref:Plus3 domain-containing protein n=1 Tax=Meloidogyne incognita TaxID=6306 RepID=A0A914MMK7_MELIC
MLALDRNRGVDQFEEVRFIHELDPVVLSRANLIRLAEKAENFDELVKNCYVRMLTKTDKVTFHAIYRIIGVIDTQVPIGKSKYAKRIRVDNQAERILESTAVDPMTQEEFDVWYKNAKLKTQPLPTIRWIRQRSDEIRLALHDASRRSEVKSVSELSKIVLSRSRLVPLVQSTEGEGIIENCFVRMVLGHDSTGQTKYGVAQIVAVTESDEYSVNVPMAGSVTTHTMYRKLTLRHVSNAYMDVGLQSISNSPIDGAEFFEWTTAYLHAALPLPLMDFIEKKERQIHEYLLSRGLLLKKVKKEEPVDDEERRAVEPVQKKLKVSRSRDLYGQ